MYIKSTLLLRPAAVHVYNWTPLNNYLNWLNSEFCLKIVYEWFIIRFCKEKSELSYRET